MSSILAAAAENTGGDVGRVLLTVIAALLGLASGYLLEVVKSRRAPRKILTWDLSVDQPKLKLPAGQADRLKFTYDGRPVEQLVIARCTLTNTGNTAIREQVVRFKLPAGADLREHVIDPVPEPEMGARDISLEDQRFPGPRYRIDQIDPGESVSFRIVADGGNWQHWDGVVLPAQESVSYHCGGVAQRRDDQAHVAPFLFGLAALLILTPLVGAASLAIWIAGEFPLNEIAYVAVIAGSSLILAAAGVYLLSHAHRAVRAMARWQPDLGSSRTELKAFGSSWFAFAPNGQINLQPGPAGARANGRHQAG